MSDTHNPNDRSDAALHERLEIAEKATQGPWKSDEVVTRKKDFEPSYVVKDKDGFTIVDVLPVAVYQANAAHIAASSPDVVRADIEEILRLRAENERLREEVARLEDMLAHLASKSVYQTVEGWWFTHGETFQVKKEAMRHVIAKAEDEMKEAARKTVEEEERHG